ncbi:hypothetical protein A2856_03510 [Candidatus Uhrbacteria bacterium RIFCSPHIGHO2_01_FULL_63_20]|uniref:Uncharacterized protein n=1 Tax=Candidatus Uhrbacteria bacterium RIFCSPHIGHO2_01_FULL_63_20 TaxID=1802385 RepID=A0A1F7TJY1_9BACT|nr:MAG: hypothetical protein A2856_03510 [Candidatus Uhrbacteria bacterium RIFCSPHIGHO2_01_FULL_63_20]
MPCFREWVIRPQDQLPHAVRGTIELDASKVRFIAPQKGKVRRSGHEWLKALKGEPVLNACVLQYLLSRSDLIPDSWKLPSEDGGYFAIAFPGTVYYSDDGWNEPSVFDATDEETSTTFVRCLLFSEGRWKETFARLARDDLDSYFLAAIWTP